jgi:spermidine/putrescine-binding protein
MTTTARMATLLGSALVAAAGAAAAADPELVVFDWAGYEDPAFFQGYVEQHGTEPTFTFFGDEEEAFQKLRSGFRADVAHPCAQSVVKWREAGLIEPLDTSRIKGWDDLMPTLRDMPGFVENGQHYLLPTDWGATMLTYRTDAVAAEEAATLQSFIDPKFQDRVSIGDNVDDAYALGFLATGVRDWTTATEADFQKASEFLRQVHQNVRTYWTDGAELGQLMQSGEVVLAWAWNETAVTLAAEGVPIAMNRDTAEGSSTYVCGYVDLKDGPGSQDKVYDFFNAWMEDRTAEFLLTAWGYGHGNAAAMAKIDPQALADSGLDNLEQYTENTLWQAPAPPALREQMIAEFEKIKAGF